MFWRVANFGNTSAVEAILDRPKFTLEDLLEEEDLIQASPHIATPMRMLLRALRRRATHTACCRPYCIVCEQADCSAQLWSLHVAGIHPGLPRCELILVRIAALWRFSV